MKRVVVSQRVDVVEKYDERRDALDQRWTGLLAKCGFAALPAPNQPAVAADLADDPAVAGILLTGGNDLAKYGGNAPERDATDRRLIEFALQKNLPLLGVCRGMQSVQDHFGIPLARVEGHVCASQEIAIDGRRTTVNSYHCFGSRSSSAELEVWAVSDDGVVKAVRHTHRKVLCVMWHPERFAAFREDDLAMFRGFFGGAR